MDATNKKIVFITAPCMDEATKIAKSLVEGRLAACVNIIPAIRSIYLWEGKVCDDTEVLLIAKTDDQNFDNLKVQVEKLHSYSTPEIVAVSIERGSGKYLRWIEECLGKTL